MTNITQFEKARFGVFRKDGRFEELPSDPKIAMRDPQHMEARWVGGEHDMQLLRAAQLASRSFSDAEVAAWAERHDVRAHLGDARQMVEDAASMHLLPLPR